MPPIGDGNRVNAPGCRRAEAARVILRHRLEVVAGGIAGALADALDEATDDLLGADRASEARGWIANECAWCGDRTCSGSCADLTPAELAYTDRLVVAGVIGIGAINERCPYDTDGDGNCPFHSDCSTLRLWKPGERRSDRIAR